MDNHSPHDEAELVPDTLTTWQSVFEIVNCPSTFLLWQFSYKGIEILLLGCLENDDRSLIFRKTVDDISEFLSGLELGELLETFRVLCVSSVALRWGDEWGGGRDMS